MRKLSFILALLFISLQGFSAEIQKEDVEINAPSGQLFGILEYPQQVEHNVKYPLVILCHGFSSNCDSPLMKTLAEDIASQGMAVLRFDFDGHGKSSGKFQDMTVPKEIDDLMCVIAWAKEKPWVESISLVGHSQGGVVASMVAGDLGESVIKCEVLMAPAAILKDDALRGNTMGAVYDPWNLTQETIELPGIPGKEPLLLGKEYILTAMSLPIYETARKYSGPVLILNGTHDRVVPYTYAERYRDELNESELKLIDREDHGFSKSMESTCSYVATWLKEQLQPAEVENVRI